MSSAQSGYASSAYGGASTQQGNQTPNSRLAQSRYFGQAGGQQQHQFHHQQQQQLGHGQHQPAAPNASSNWLQQGVLNVTPWIEQQQQVSNSSNSLENQNFVNNYGNNLNSNYVPQRNLAQHQQQHHQQQQLNAQSNQSIQTNFDSQSTRASPTASNNETQNDETNNNNNTNNVSNDDVAQNDNDDSNENENDETNNTKDSNDNDVDDELIPTAIVIKNIPFAIKKEQLLEVMTKLNLPLPYAFNYHFDNGVFRGLAFANFTSTDETTAVVTQLNGREIGGRKLRVEYKKMLPLAERERIEREKREKRGQLEEQHRSTSNASLASLISVASAPAGVVNAANAHVHAAAAANAVNVVNANNSGGVHNQSCTNLVGQGLKPNMLSPQSERFYAPIPFVNNLPIPPQQVDFNDPETLEYYSQLLFFRDDKDRAYLEIAYPSTLSQNHKRIISILTAFLGLIETYENNLILIKRRSLIHDPSPLLRSHSHSAIPLLQSQANQHQGQLPIGNQQLQQQQQQQQPQQQQPPPQQQQQQQPRYRNQNPNQLPPQSPAQQHTTNSRIPPNFSLSGGLNANQNQALSSAAILRNNPTPTRIGGPNLYNQAGFLNQSTSQPTTPGIESFSRYNLTNQPLQPQQSGQSNQSQHTPQFANATLPQQSAGPWDNQLGGINGSSAGSNEAELNESLNALNLGLDNGSNIWGSGRQPSNI